MPGRILGAALVLAAMVSVPSLALAQEDVPVEEDPPVCPDDIRAIAGQVLADADTRATLTGSNCGHDGSFFLGTEDDRFRLKVGGYTQFRYYLDFSDSEDVGSDFESGFTVARARVIIAGTLKEPGIDFLLLPAAGPSGRWFLLDAWVRHTFENGWSVKAGQAKLPFFREWLVSERFLLAVERSNVSAVFASIYGQEVEVCHTGDSLGIHLSFSDGLRTLNTDFDSDREADFAFTGRAEIKFQGEWKQFFDMTALGNEEAATMLGFAGHIQGRTNNFSGEQVKSLAQYTVDFSHEELDWSMMAAFVGRHAEVVDIGTVNEFGALAQGALFVADEIELLARYSVIIPDSSAEGNDLFHTVTGGLNYYLFGQAAKFSVDVVWFIGEQSDTDVLGFRPSAGLGLLPRTGSNQVAIRTQFQLIF